MNFKNTQITFIDAKEIEKRSLNLREKTGRVEVPVEVEKIVEINFKINIWPKPRLRDECDVDALLLSSFRDIIVDKKMHDDERNRNRFRFSLAHELGHLVLHKEKWKEFSIKGTEDYREFLKKIDGKKYGFLEKQADIFANYLLVPREKLKKEKTKIIYAYIGNKMRVQEFDKRVLNSYLAKPLAKKFKVSEQVMEIALQYLE